MIAPTNHFDLLPKGVEAVIDETRCTEKRITRESLERVCVGERERELE